MKTISFYEERKEYEKYYEEYDGSWDFLENIKPLENYTGRLSAYDFLHGFCDSFATMLHEKYGYDLYQVRNENEEMCPLVHAFAMKDGCFIDIRGITDNFYEFFEEFEDFIDMDEIRIIPMKPIMLLDDPKNFLEEFMKDYGSYYKFSKELRLRLEFTEGI